MTKLLSPSAASIICLPVHVSPQWVCVDVEYVCGQSVDKATLEENMRQQLENHLKELTEEAATLQNELQVLHSLLFLKCLDFNDTFQKRNTKRINWIVLFLQNCCCRKQRKPWRLQQH